MEKFVNDFVLHDTDNVLSRLPSNLRYMIHKKYRPNLLEDFEPRHVGVEERRKETRIPNFITVSYKIPKNWVCWICLERSPTIHTLSFILDRNPRCGCYRHEETFLEYPLICYFCKDLFCQLVKDCKITSMENLLQMMKEINYTDFCLSGNGRSKNLRLTLFGKKRLKAKKVIA
jgi:hypothetical protein